MNRYRPRLFILILDFKSLYLFFNLSNKILWLKRKYNGIQNRYIFIVIPCRAYKTWKYFYLIFFSLLLTWFSYSGQTNVAHKPGMIEHMLNETFWFTILINSVRDEDKKKYRTVTKRTGMNKIESVSNSYLKRDNLNYQICHLSVWCQILKCVIVE